MALSLLFKFPVFFSILINTDNLLSEPRKPLVSSRSWSYQQAYNDDGPINPIWFLFTSENVNPFSSLEDVNPDRSIIGGRSTQLDDYDNDPSQPLGSDKLFYPKRSSHHRSDGSTLNLNSNSPPHLPTFTGSKILDILLRPGPNFDQYPKTPLSAPTVESRSLALHNVHSRPLYYTQNRLDGSLSSHYREHGQSTLASLIFVAIVSGVTLLAIFLVVGSGYVFHRVNQMKKAAVVVDYPAYGICGPQSKTTSGSPPNQPPSGDRKLAQSAQMYHYHHQKQQMISTEKIQIPGLESPSDPDTESENEEGDYTVYECPGLASTTGEIEVKNPLFLDDPNSASLPPLKNCSEKP